MRGFFNNRARELADLCERTTDARDPVRLGYSLQYQGPLTAAELSAAKTQGCVGCVWWTATTTRRAAACHHASKAGAVQADPDFWCSEWRGEPSEETP